MAEIPASFELTKRPRADGALDLVGKDDSGKEYVARTCLNGHVTDDDLKELQVGDRTQSTAHDLTQRVIDRREAFKRDQADKLEDSMMEAAGPVVYAGFHGFWGKGYGEGEVRRSANGSAIPRRRRFTCDPKTGKVVEL